MTTATTTYQSRWGFHPVDYETFLKLKFLKKHYHQTTYDLGRWRRWERKTVHQHGPEPLFCPFFDGGPGYSRVIHHQNDQVYVGYVHREKNPVDRGVLAAYETARAPRPNPESVQSLELTQTEIDRLFQQVQAWCQEHGRC